MLVDELNEQRSLLESQIKIVDSGEPMSKYKETKMLELQKRHIQGLEENLRQ